MVELTDLSVVVSSSQSSSGSVDVDDELGIVVTLTVHTAVFSVVELDEVYVATAVVAFIAAEEFVGQWYTTVVSSEHGSSPSTVVDAAIACEVPVTRPVPIAVGVTVEFQLWVTPVLSIGSLEFAGVIREDVTLLG